MRSGLPFVALLALAGCVGAPQPSPERRVTYACDNGPSITVVYSEGVARIVSSESSEDIVLQQKPSGSGFSYESSTHSIRGKGNQITYTVGRMMPMTCRAAPEPR